MDKNEDTYAKRLKIALSLAAKYDSGLKMQGSTDGNMSELARRVGIKPQAIQYLATDDEANKRSKHTTKIAKELRVYSDWLDTGEGPKLLPEHWEIQDANDGKAINREDLSFDVDLVDLIVTRLNIKLKHLNKKLTKVERKTVIKGAYNFLKSEHDVTPEKVDNVINLIDYKEQQVNKEIDDEQHGSSTG